jgi:hydrocephalus-inducing protein
VRVEFPADNEWWSCDSPDVSVKQLGDINNGTEGAFEVTYRPLVVTPEAGPDAMLTLQLGEALGEYKYPLTLRASAAGSEGMLSFKAALGMTARRQFKFTSFMRTAGSYSCEVKSHPDCFTVAKVVEVEADSGGGVSAAVEVEFEPSQMGVMKDTLVLSSPDGGEYRCVLAGECTAPLPQGPIEVAAGGSAAIKFKNVLAKSHKFQLCIADSEAFSVSPTEQDIAPKAEATFTVKYDGSAPAEAPKSPSHRPVAGKLLVKCMGEDAAATGTAPTWTFYLAGKPQR